MPDANCVRKADDRLFIIGNLRRNEIKNKINETRYSKPYLPWLISAFDLSAELGGVNVDVD
jgi:hypothetical protein